MPFVQGHLRHASLSIRFRSACAHCERTLEIEIDSDLRYRATPEAKPLVFVPFVDFARLKDPSIIHAF